jgi:hypothetical protein
MNFISSLLVDSCGGIQAARIKTEKPGDGNRSDRGRPDVAQRLLF